MINFPASGRSAPWRYYSACADERETINLHINFVVKDPDGSWRLLLVEGPWDEPLDSENLRKVEKRISDCVTASINGYHAERYPESLGRPVVIQVDSYDMRVPPFGAFFGGQQ